MRFIAVGAGLLLIATLTGCPNGDFGFGLLVETPAWSPDGKHLAFIGPDDERLWTWDAKREISEPSAFGIDADTGYCRYLSKSAMLLIVRREEEEKKSYSALYLCERGREPVELVRDIERMEFDVSGNGKYLYYVQTVEEEKEPAEDGETPKPTKRHELVEMRLGKKRAEKVLVSGPMDLACPAADRTGDRIAFLQEAEDDGMVVRVFEKKTGKTRTAIPWDGIHYYYWPVWVDRNRFVALRMGDPDSADDPPGLDELFAATLVVHDLKAGVTKKLCTPVFGFAPPSLDEDHEHAALTSVIGEQDEAWAWQVVVVDLETGAIRAQTDEPFGAGMAVFHPRKNRVAYLSPPMLEKEALVRILDIDSGRITTVARREDERLLGEAEQLELVGLAGAAVATYGRLLQDFPDTPLAPQVWSRLLALQFNRPRPDLDGAFDCLTYLGADQVRPRDLEPFWSLADRVATDPAGDLLRTYGTDASKNEFKFDTDTTRDLTALWARWSSERVYLRIDYNSPQDLTGKTFQDTILLLDLDSPAEGLRDITPLAQWAWGAEWCITMRQWARGAAGEDLDVLCRNGSGEAVDLDLVVHDTSTAWRDSPGSVTLSLPRAALGIEGRKRVQVQVCTTKGGDESEKGLERPREVPGQPGAACDIADAFGPGNAPKGPLTESEGISPTPGVVHDYAAVLELNGE